MQELIEVFKVASPAGALLIAAFLWATNKYIPNEQKKSEAMIAAFQAEQKAARDQHAQQLKDERDHNRTLYLSMAEDCREREKKLTESLHVHLPAVTDALINLSRMMANHDQVTQKMLETQNFVARRQRAELQAICGRVDAKPIYDDVTT